MIYILRFIEIIASNRSKICFASSRFYSKNQGRYMFPDSAIHTGTENEFFVRQMDRVKLEWWNLLSKSGKLRFDWINKGRLNVMPSDPCERSMDIGSVF